MSVFDLARAKVGERIQHQFLVAERSERQASNGNPFVILSLTNRTGRIDTAPIWSEKLAWVDGVEKGRVVQIIGNVNEWGKDGQKKRQVDVTAAVHVVPAGQARLEDFLPRIADDPQVYWERIDKARGRMKSPSLRRVVDLFFADDAFRERFERWPASVNAHHATVGGLLQHVTEVAVFAHTMATTMGANPDLALTGALLHDIGKLEAYMIGPGGFAYTPANALIGHVVLGMLMFEQRLPALGDPPLAPSQVQEVRHLILSHHGVLEFGSPVVPVTLEAEIVHWADEASAKANDMGDALADASAFAEGEEVSQRIWRVSRKVWRRPHDWR